jgi:hypothetical protein
MWGLTKSTVQKFNKDKIYINILLSNDSLFFEAYYVARDAFYYIVQYIGSSQFKYEFVLESGAEEIIVCFVASSYSMYAKEVYNMGKCVKLFCDTIERVLDEDKNLQSSISRKHINMNTLRHNVSVVQSIFTSSVNHNMLKNYY